MCVWVFRRHHLCVCEFLVVYLYVCAFCTFSMFFFCIFLCAKILLHHHPSTTNAGISPITTAISSTTIATDRQTQPQLHQQQQLPTQIAPTPTRKRATSFIRKKPPLERGLSAQSALRVNKNAFVCMCVDGII